MKKGKSKLRRLDDHGVRVLNKTMPVANPTNRAERRLAAKLDRKKPKKD